ESDRRLIREWIFRAFQTCQRIGAISWNQAMAVDLNCSESDFQKALLKDQDSCWQDLISDENWDPDCSLGGWSFLDAIGFRYYLPAGLVRALELNGEGWNFSYSLAVPQSELRTYRLNQLSLLNKEQVCAVKFSVELLAKVDRILYDDSD